MGFDDIPEAVIDYIRGAFGGEPTLDQILVTELSAAPAAFLRRGRSLLISRPTGSAAAGCTIGGRFKTLQTVQLLCLGC